MGLSGLEIYKLLPKTNCRKCGFATCLAFAMQLAKKAVGLDKCPYVSQESKKTLEEATLAPIRLVSIGTQGHKLQVGNETVLFRHEEKFYHPTGIGFIIDDALDDEQIRQKLALIGALRFERIGCLLEPDLIALRQRLDKERFLAALRLILDNSDLALVLMSDDLKTQEQALQLCSARRPLIYAAREDNLSGFAELASRYKVPLVVRSPDIQQVMAMTKELASAGIEDVVLDTGKKALSDKIWDLTSIRRLALKKRQRLLGYPTIAVLEDEEGRSSYQNAMEAAVFIAKYASIVLIPDIERPLALSLLTLRQNIYTDPQKPLQIEPKLYMVGQATKQSPLLVTTNFSLTYYTVLGEVEASKIPSYILTVDTEGMSVLTAWAAEKFTPEKIAQSLDKFALKQTLSHNRLIIPGYVAVMSGDLEEKSNWQVIVGPKEASGIPVFLKNL
jgi:acetyl-CoA decarbonylase/synthase complex subunit gamma